MKKNNSKFTVQDMAQIALVAAIYVVLTVTPPLNVISYGAVQFRISEMMNFTAFYNPKYIIGVTLGCMIANFYQLGLLDVFVGGGSTLVFLSLGVYLFRKYNKDRIFKGLMPKSFFYFAIFFSLSMITIAAEIYFISSKPISFWLTWFTLALGEFASLFVGAIIMDRLSKVIDLSR